MDLPPELWHEILGYLPGVDLKSTRLTCDALDGIAAQRLFRRVYFAPRVAAMERFETIRAKSYFAHNIRELVYDARLFVPRLGSYSEYKKLYDAAYRTPNDADTQPLKERSDGIHDKFELLPSGQSGGDDSYYAMIDSGISDYKELLDQQEVIFDKEKDYKILCSALEKLPNIVNIAMLSNFHRPISDPYHQHEHFQQLTTRDFGYSIGPSSWEQCYRQDIVDWDVRGSHNLMKAISNHCTNITGLQTGDLRGSACPIKALLLSPEDTEKVRSLFRGLTCCRFLVTRSELQSGDKRHKNTERVISLFGELVNVSDITINWWCSNPGWLPSDLTKLELVNLDIPLSSLVINICTCKKSLRELRLRRIELLEGSWRKFCGEMRENLNLRFAGIAGISTPRNEISRHRHHDLLINMFTESAKERIQTGYEGLRRGTLLKTVPLEGPGPDAWRQTALAVARLTEASTSQYAADNPEVFPGAEKLTASPLQ